jgi:RNA polymerase sigma-70 factor (ECF subfamily)
MLPPQGESIRTRSSLLRRVRRWDDQTSWKDFHDTYKRIVRSVVLQSGLTEAEADDVVQETFLEVAKKMPTFEYDPKRGSFKAWLLRLTRWRILDHLRRRRRARASLATGTANRFRTALIESVPDPAAASLDTLLEKEWQTEMVQTALMNVRRRADPEKFQIFDLYVQQEWPAKKVARTLGLSLNQVYLAKSRITEMLKAEVKRLEQGRG